MAASSSATATTAALSLDHMLSAATPTEQLCYVHCNLCDIVLMVSVPCNNLFRTVTIRCDHYSNLLSVNMWALLLPPPPPANHQFHLAVHNLLLAPTHNNILEEISCAPPPLLLDQTVPNNFIRDSMGAAFSAKNRSFDHHETPQVPDVNRPPEKRQRVLSAYNHFIKDKIQRIKAGNLDITHREAFSAAAKNWAHFPHIHFGLMPDQNLKKNSMRQQNMQIKENLAAFYHPGMIREDGGRDHEVMLKEGGFYAAAAAAANMRATPY